MGVNATGTLGCGSQVERRRRENRGAVGGEGRWGLKVSSQNGVMWCILGVLFLRFICSMDCSCMINFIDENDSDLRLVKILGVATPATPAALTPMAISAEHAA